MRDSLEQGRRPAWLGCSLLLAVSIAALSGCMSSVSTDLRAESVAVPAGAEAAGDDDAPESPPAAVRTATREDTAEPALAAGAPAETEPGADRAGLVLGETALDAGRTSIYSASGGEAAVPAYAAEGQARNAALKSIYAAPAADGSAEGRLPVEDMPVLDPSAARQPLPLAGTEHTATEPAAVPLPLAKTTRMASAAEPVDAQEEEDGEPRAASPQAAGRRKLTLSTMFGAKKQADAKDGARQAVRRTIDRDRAATIRTASLAPVDSLPGVTLAAIPAADTHSEADEPFDAEVPRFREIALLGGLARLAPNGLLLQTEKVRANCLKPELLKVLKTVERHYGKPIIVTSGLRDKRPGRSRQSLHTRCEAADIQISGVGKWELAEYLRGLPGRGGVGTYCHTESVHIDIGPERDWNWRCRRRK